MNYLNAIFENKVLMCAILGWLIAQILKTIIYLALTRKFVPERLVGSGGMPSSHSATVCALAASVGILYGLSSFEFAISVIFAIVVMHDASGVRWETGMQAKVLNEMMEILSLMGTNMSATDKLKEFVGHTHLQVFAGAILGILIACLFCL